MSEERPSVRLLLIRHGEASGGVGYHAETPLTERGRAQAAHTGRALLRHQPSSLLTSPLRLARETASIIAESLRLDPAPDEALREFVIGGEETLPLEAMQATRDDLQYWRPEHRPADHLESLREFQQRVGLLLDGLAGLTEHPVIALVSHAGTIDASIRWAYGLGPDAPWTAEADIANASITVIEHWPQGRHPSGAPRYSELSLLGDVTHLPEELR